MDGRQMVDGCLGDGGMDSEKITINLGAVDLGKIDVLVEEGFYGNRTDFIRTAIRNHLDRHESDMNQTIVRKAMSLGALHYTRQDFERFWLTKHKLVISSIGLVSIASDVPPDLASGVVQSLTVRGVFRASQEVKDALADRTH
jgi:Arc/MetJ-type ribon-helix-helix transcriptional regulator